LSGLSVPETLDGMRQRRLTITEQHLDALQRAPHHRYDVLLVDRDEVHCLGAISNSGMEQRGPQRPGTPAYVYISTLVPEVAPPLLM
jgi:hypothetical protein